MLICHLVHHRSDKRKRKMKSKMKIKSYLFLFFFVYLFFFFHLLYFLFSLPFSFLLLSSPPLCGHSVPKSPIMCEVNMPLFARRRVNRNRLEGGDNNMWVGRLLGYLMNSDQMNLFLSHWLISSV